MATIPDPNELTRRSFSGRTNITTVQTGAVERATTNAAGNDGEQARAMGNVVSAFGENVAKLAEREKLRLDDVSVKEYRNKAVETSITRLEEARAVKGTGVIKNEYVKTQLANMDKDNEALTTGLMNESQKEQAKEWYGQFRTGFGREVTMHAIRETDKVEQSNFEGEVRSWLNYGVAAPTNTDITTTAVEGVRNAVINRLTKEGADPLDIGTQALTAAGNVHKQIIDSLRAQGNISYANQYLKENLGDMSAEQATTAQESLRRVTDYQQGVSVGQQAYDILAAGGSPVDADKFLKSQKLSVEALSAAKATLSDSQIAVKRANDEKSGGLFMKFRETDKSAAAMGAIIRSDEFNSLPKVEQDQAMDHLDRIRRSADAEADEARREGKQARAESEERRSNSPKSIALIGSLLDQPDALAKMSNAQITAMEPTIGNTNVGKLLAVKNSVLKGAATFKLDPALVNEALSGVKDKEDQKVLKGAISAKLMDFKLQNPGVNPTPAQQAEIARAGQETWIDTTALFLKEEPAFKIKQGKGFPLTFKAQFPDHDEDEVLAKYNDFVVLYRAVQKDARAKGKVPPPEDRVLAQFKRLSTVKKSSDVPLTPFDR